MLLFSQIVSEEKIRRAIKEGQFENLEGRGKPLRPDDAEHLPPDLRMAYRVLRNSGYVPAEITEEREITRMIDLLEHMEDEGMRYRQIQKLNIMITQMNERLGRPVQLEGTGEYYRRIVEKVKIAEERFKKDN